MFADIALPNRRYQIFTYLVPADLHKRIHIGSRVLVPLGGTTAQGLVFHLASQLSSGLGDRGIARSQLREIAGLIDTTDNQSLPSSLVQLADQVADYYLAPPASGLRLVIPPPLPGRVSKRIILTDLGRHALSKDKLSPNQVALLTRLSKSSNGLTLDTLRKTIKNVGPILTRLKRKEWIVEEDRIRNVSSPDSPPPKEESLPTDLFSPGKEEPDSINVPMSTSVLALVNKEEDHDHAGVEPSESFDVWRKKYRHTLSKHLYETLVINSDWAIRQKCLVQAVLDTLKDHRTVLILIPEINQASRVTQFLTEQLKEQVGLYHGDLPLRVRSRLWHAMRNGQYRVVVGTRLALFLPLSSLGLIWMEREDDPSYQEEQIPSYHARVVAHMRAKLASCLLVLSSLHPSLETVHQFSNQMPHLLTRTSTSGLGPEVQLANLQHLTYGTLLSDTLINGMHKTLGAKGSVILFLNRKGFSRALLCRDCGHVPQCSACGVTLTLFKKPPRLMCSYCGQTHIPPVVCSSCQSTRLEPTGFGTERLEEIVQQQFPLSKVARFDREVVKTAEEETLLLERFTHGKVNILIGTELLFHFPQVLRADFVGIPYADGGLHTPDFRSAERTYRLLEEAVRLTGVHEPHAIPREVVIQTYLPMHHVMQAVVQRDPRIFYDQELGFREALGYPPFTHVIHLTVSGKYHDRVSLAAHRCRDLLVAGLKNEQDSILGPIPSPRPRSPGNTQYVIVIKSRECDRDRQLVRGVHEELTLALRSERMAMEVQVDPLEIL